MNGQLRFHIRRRKLLSCSILALGAAFSSSGTNRPGTHSFRTVLERFPWLRTPRTLQVRATYSSQRVYVLGPLHVGFYVNGLWKDYQLADFGQRLLDEYGIDEPIDGLLLFPRQREKSVRFRPCAKPGLRKQLPKSLRFRRRHPIQIMALHHPQRGAVTELRSGLRGRPEMRIVHCREGVPHCIQSSARRSGNRQTEHGRPHPHVRKSRLLFCKPALWRERVESQVQLQNIHSGVTAKSE